MIQQKGAESLVNSLTRITQRKFMSKLKSGPEMDDSPDILRSEREEVKHLPEFTKPKVPVITKRPREASKLPPIRRGPVSLNVRPPPPPESVKLERAVKRETNLGFLQMGDIISLTAKENDFKGIISGDGVSQIYLECVPKRLFSTPSSNMQLRQVLFTIEPPIEYCSNSANSRSLNSELFLYKEKKISFGERIQLRHINSHSFLTCSDEVGRAPGTLRIMLDAIGSESSWIETVPTDKLRKLGEFIKYTDAFALCIHKDKTKYFIHMDTAETWQEDQTCELNGSITRTIWYAQRFSGYSELHLDQDQLVTGNCLRIYNPQAGGYISVRSRTDQELLPGELQLASSSPQENDLLSCTVDKAALNPEKASKLIIEKKKNSMSLWELERSYPFEGGPIKWHESYRLKNVATGLFLTANNDEPANLRLSSEGRLESTLFTFLPESVETEFVSFKSIAMLQSCLNKWYLHSGKTKKSHDLALSTRMPGYLGVCMNSERTEKEPISFSFVDEPENQTVHIFQIASIIPKVVNYYCYLQKWGMLANQDGLFVHSFDAAKDCEPELRYQTDFVQEILKNLSSKILRPGSSMKKRQNAVRETGLLVLLLKLAEMIETKLRLPEKFPRESMPRHIQKSNLKILHEIISKNIREYMNISQVVATPYLYNLALRLYEALYLCVKDNLRSCQALVRFDSFLAGQLSSYRVQVGKILKEIFKFLDVTDGAVHHSKLWISLLKPIHESEDNLEEQKISLKILASLCVNNGVGVPWFQKNIENALFSPDGEYQYLSFTIHMGEPCFKISAGSSVDLNIFLQNNPELAALAVPTESPQERNIFKVRSFGATSRYTPYLAAFLKLMGAVCLSRNESAAEHIIQDLKFSFDHAMRVIKTDVVHPLIKTGYITLITQLFVDRSPRKSIMHAQSACYLIHPNTYEIEQEAVLEDRNTISLLNQPREGVLRLDELVDWLISLVDSVDMPGLKKSSVQLSGIAQSNQLGRLMKMSMQNMDLQNEQNERNISDGQNTPNLQNRSSLQNGQNMSMQGGQNALNMQGWQNALNMQGQNALNMQGGQNARNMQGGQNARDIQRDQNARSMQGGQNARNMQDRQNASFAQMMENAQSVHVKDSSQVGSMLRQSQSMQNRSNEQSMHNGENRLSLQNLRNENLAQAIDSEFDRKAFFILVTEVFKLSSKLVEFSFAGYNFVEKLFKVIIVIINLSGAGENAVDKLHWSYQLRLNLSKVNARAYDKLLMSCLQMLKVGYTMRLGNEVKDILQKLLSSLKTGQMLAANAFINQMPNEKDVQVRGANQIVPQDLSDTYSMDVILLFLLFHNGDARIKKLSLELITRNFNHNESLVSFLEDICLFSQGPGRDYYKSIIELQKRLSEELRQVKLAGSLAVGGQLKLRTDPHFQRHRHYLESYLKEMKQKLVFTTSQPLNISQLILKSLGSYKELLELLTDSWPWVVITETYSRRVDPMMLDIYELAVSILSLFCYQSNKHKHILFPHIKSLVSLMENPIGVTKLIGEVLSSERNSPVTTSIIKGIFAQMENRRKPFEEAQELQMIFSLVMDEDGKFYPVNQTNTVKALMNCQILVDKMKSKISDIDSMMPSETKYWTVALKLLSVVSINNSFATLQCRSLASFRVLDRELKKAGERYRLKKYYLHAVFYIHLMQADNRQAKILGNAIEDLLYRVVLPDIADYTKFVRHLESLCRNGAYKVCLPKEAPDRRTLEITKSAVLGMLAGSEIKADLTMEQVTALDYFKYITTHSKTCTAVCTGLLCFMRNLCESVRDAEVSSEVERMLGTIRFEILCFYNDLFDVAERVNDIDFEKLLNELAETAIEIHGEPDGSEKAYYELLEILVGFFNEGSLLVSDFPATMEADASFCLHKKSFLVKFKKMLKDRIHAAQIFNAMFHLPIENDLVNISDINEYLTVNAVQRSMFALENNYGAAYLLITPKDPQVELGKLANSLRKKINEDKYIELKKLVQTLKKNVLDAELDNPEGTALRVFLLQLQTVFSKDRYQIYLLNIFSYLMDLEKDRPSNKSKQLSLSVRTKKVEQSRIERLLNLYINIGVIDLALGLISKQSKKEILIGAQNLLITLLRANPRSTMIRAKILECLKTSMAQEVFVFLQHHIRETRDLIFAYYKNKKKGITVMSVECAESIKFCISIFTLVQLCCDSCYLPFQNFFREQDNTGNQVSVNLVKEIGSFLRNFPKLPELKDAANTSELTAVVKQCLWALTDLCQGPCSPNQDILGNNKGIFDFLGWLIGKDNYALAHHIPWFDLLSEAIKFMKSLVESCSNIHIPVLMYDNISENELFKHSTNIWANLVRGKEEMVFQENKGAVLPLFRKLGIVSQPFNDFELTAIETGFNIYVLSLYINMYSKMSGMMVKSSLIKNREDMSFEQQIQVQVNQIESLNERESIYESAVQMFRYIYSRITFDNQENPEQTRSLALRFFASCISSVEIQKDNRISQLFFRVPPMMRYFTNKSREEVSLKVYKTTHHERIEELIDRSHRYEIEMAYQQKLARYPILDKITSKWRSYSNYSFFIVVIINIMLLVTVQHESGRTGDWELTDDNLWLVFAVLSGFQIAFAGLVFFCYIAEYYPVLIYKRLTATRTSQMRKYESSGFNRVKGTLLTDEFVRNVRESTRKTRFVFLSNIYIILTDLQCFYNLCYFVLSLIALYWTLYYSILLLDIVRRNRLLINVLKSITLNWFTLVMTLMLIIIVIYLFSYIAYLVFSDDYVSESDDADMNTYCDTLFLCWVSTSITGVRAGGGIGDWILQRGESDSLYYPRMIFDLMYFIFIIIILLNIIFGIIIDTFAQLRDERNEREKVMNEICYICGLNRFQFEVNRINWKYHIEVEHNINAYLSLLIYVRNKPLEDCNGLEKFVYEDLQLGEFSFFPTTSQSLLTAEGQHHTHLN